MGLKKIGSLWNPRDGGKSIATGYLQDSQGNKTRIVIIHSKYAGQREGNADYIVMMDDGQGDTRSQSNGWNNNQPKQAPPQNNWGGPPQAGPPQTPWDSGGNKGGGGGGGFQGPPANPWE